jgi:hypothetical protein
MKLNIPNLFPKAASPPLRSLIASQTLAKTHQDTLNYFCRFSEQSTVYYGCVSCTIHYLSQFSGRYLNCHVAHRAGYSTPPSEDPRQASQDGT